MLQECIIKVFLALADLKYKGSFYNSFYVFFQKLSFLVLIPLDICATKGFLIAPLHDSDMTRWKVNENNICNSNKKYSFVITAHQFTVKCTRLLDFILLFLPQFIFDFLLLNVLLSG